MKNFKNFSKFVTDHKIKLQFNYQDQDRLNTQSKMDKLLDGIISGAYSNDDEASLALYRSNSSNRNYQMLKSRIKDRLISHIFQVNPLKRLKISRYHYYFILTHKYLTAGQLMINLGLVYEGEKLLKQGIRMAIEHQFSGLIVFAARLLRALVGFQGTRKEINYYNRLIEVNIESYTAELESDKMRDDLNIDFRQSFAPQQKTKLLRYWKRINYLNEKYDNHVLKINRARIGAKYFETIGDFKGVIRICDAAEDYMLKNNKFYERPRHRDFAMIKMEACLNLKEYELGIKNAEIAMGLFANNINSLIVIEYYVLLCLHTKSYQKAWELFDSAISNPIFKSYPLERKEKWKLFEAYLSFIFPQPKRKFKLFKFLNEVTVYSKDKKGLNVSIMLAQILLLLDEGNFDTLLDKADSFKVYFRRYVTRHINYRTFYFVKMIDVMFKHNFQYQKVKTISEKFYERLSDKKGHYKGDIESLEIIPYEELWIQVLERLKKHEFSFS